LLVKWSNNYQLLFAINQLPSSNYELQITAAIIRATCTFDAKIAGFLKGDFFISAFVEMNKKIYKNSDFCF